MNYLVIKDNTIIQICTSIEDLLEYLEITINGQGVVKVTNDGRELPTTYNIVDFTKEDIMKDVIKNKIKTIESMLKIGIYKLERI